MELHQVELRYSALRKRTQRKEQQLVASLAEHGQMLPVVVIAASEPGRFVLIDGYKRVRALKRLGRDTARATVWDLGEADALVLERLMRASEADSPIEQGWLLAELRSSFGLSLEELARRFDKSKSWVSRRLALVGELPAGVQTHVQQGGIAPHAAMKFFVPLARANVEHCTKLAAVSAQERLSVREVASLYAAYKAADAPVRERLCAEPMLFLRALAEQERKDGEVPGHRELLADFDVLGGVARRASRRLRDGITPPPSPAERSTLTRAAAQARQDAAALFNLVQQELARAG